MVVVGSHGLNVLERLALGSTVRTVLRHSKCSVEIVRAPRKETATDDHRKRILVATDGSEFAKAAVKAVASEAWPRDTDIKIISVPEFALWLGDIAELFHKPTGLNPLWTPQMQPSRKQRKFCREQASR